MISTSVMSMLDRVRSEFGFRLDVLDADLVSVLAPDRQPERAVRARPELSAAALAAVRGSRASELQVEGRIVRLLPLRRDRAAIGLLVVESETGLSIAGPAGRLLDALLELLRNAIEADLGVRQEIDLEHRQNRTLHGMLRFLTHVLTAATEGDVAEAVLHAAAVWFDVDPRVYRREPNGDYVLFAQLPAAEIAAGSERISGLDFAPDATLVRLSSNDHARVFGSTADGFLVPARGARSGDWLLVVYGAVSPEAEFTLSLVAQVFGAQMDRLSLRHDTEVRRHFEDILLRSDRPTELRALEVARQLVWMTNGSAAAVWIQDSHGLRRIALVGADIQDPGPVLPVENSSSRTRYVRTIHLRDESLARLELLAAETPLGAGTASIVDTCASVLRVWLSAIDAAGRDSLMAFDAGEFSSFVRRIEEELARARRFDRRLALLLVQAPHGDPGRVPLQEFLAILRRELRESDLLGTLGRDRIVALLVETDASGVGAVVRRVRARLDEEAAIKGLPNLAVGEAAFSEECTTVAALLSRAEFNAQAVSGPM